MDANVTFDWSINIPTIIAIGSVIIGGLNLHGKFVHMKLKVDQMWEVHEDAIKHLRWKHGRKIDSTE